MALNDPKTLKEWLRLNPNHTALCSLDPGDQVRVVLSGGPRSDGPYSGLGDDEGEAIRHALEARAAIRKELP